MFARIWIHLQFLTVGSCLKVFPLVIVMSSGKFRCGTFHRHNITRLAWGPPCTLFYMDSLGKHYFCWTSTTPPQNTSWPKDDPQRFQQSGSRQVGTDSVDVVHSFPVPRWTVYHENSEPSQEAEFSTLLGNWSFKLTWETLQKPLEKVRCRSGEMNFRGGNVLLTRDVLENYSKCPQAEEKNKCV